MKGDALFIVIYCLIASLMSLYAADSPPYQLMESPYADMDYAALRTEFDDLRKMQQEGAADWDNAPYAIGRVHVSQGTAACCLKACKMIMPCAICCMATNGCTCAAGGLAIICGLRQVNCIKKLFRMVEPISFDDSPRGKILKLQLAEIQKEMTRCSEQEKNELVHRVICRRSIHLRSPSRSPSSSPAYSSEKEKMD